MDTFLHSPTYENIKYWSFGDQQTSTSFINCEGSNGIFPLASFNHISREVINLERSKQFYSNILGFYEIPRPNLDCNGCWLYGYGIRSLNLSSFSLFLYYFFISPFSCSHIIVFI